MTTPAAHTMHVTRTLPVPHRVCACGGCETCGTAHANDCKGDEAIICGRPSAAGQEARGR